MQILSSVTVTFSFVHIRVFDANSHTFIHFVSICSALWTRMQIISSVTVTFSFVCIHVFDVNSHACAFLKADRKFP